MVLLWFWAQSNLNASFDDAAEEPFPRSPEPEPNDTAPSHASHRATATTAPNNLGRPPSYPAPVVSPISRHSMDAQKVSAAPDTGAALNPTSTSTAPANSTEPVSTAKFSVSSYGEMGPYSCFFAGTGRAVGCGHARGAGAGRQLVPSAGHWVPVSISFAVGRKQVHLICIRQKKSLKAHEQHMWPLLVI